MPALKEYTRKRDFKKTAEPRAMVSNGNASRFVIQKHAASRLHYDFRLEAGGVLKSWALPRGVPFAKGEKHLAVQVEDHPVSYADFEGAIPEGQYGGGTVMVWDTGIYSTEGKPALEEIKSGKVHLALKGKKLHGAWHLVRLRDGNQWLIIKGGESLKPVSQKADDTSALSGKTMKQLSQNGVVWESKPHASESSGQTSFVTRLRDHISAKERERGSFQVKFIEPMKARVAESPPSAGDWIYEIKFDGYRAMAFKQGQNARMLSRNEKDLNEKFPEIVEAISTIDADDAIIDGEIVALDTKGVPSFQLLQATEMGDKRPPLFYYAFDLLRLNRKDLRRQPLDERKAQLERILGDAPGIVRYSASLGSDAAPLLEHVKKLGLEGLIGKRRDSLYEAGQRSGAWIKLKLRHEQEFVIGGYTNPEGARTHFGALLVGFYENKKFKFCGKVGTGFSAKLLASLHRRFAKIACGKCPFVNLPEARGSRYSPRITPAEMRKCHWVEPKLVCQVAFSEWTRDDKLRQPAFLGLREDKAASEVVREKAE